MSWPLVCRGGSAWCSCAVAKIDVKPRQTAASNRTSALLIPHLIHRSKHNLQTRQQARRAHSSRSNIMGSTDSARRAGIHVASSPSNDIARTTPAKTSGSRGVA